MRTTTLPGARAKIRHDRGSTIPLMLGFFIIAGLMLTAGVVASAAFVQLRSLQSACDGAAIAATNGFGRVESVQENLPFHQGAAEAAVSDYAAAAWGSGGVAITVQVSGEVVTVQCSRTANVPFQAVFAPNGISQTVTSTARAPLIG